MNRKLVLGARASRARGEAVATATRIVKKSNKHGNIVRLNKDELELGTDLPDMIYICAGTRWYYYNTGCRISDKIEQFHWRFFAGT